MEGFQLVPVGLSVHILKVSICVTMIGPNVFPLLWPLELDSFQKTGCVLGEEYQVDKYLKDKNSEPLWLSMA